ncbi:hypothetical protein FIBSPDRAFT_848538 [Athelia psychrophila]|uniref:Uncharacterized protein n=1 Tax=Athelia psychrophila TaxID=1759441 RepID=A0A166UZ06_9AGAM|nr:hypothetical protein FIBSPDRAFT_848538 [Fibularhizoctonia sp. CBS 109695]
MSSTPTKVREEGTSRFPRVISYVTIKLDPVKSVEIFEDDEATTAAQGAVSKVYVGYIPCHGAWRDDEDEENANYLIHLLRSGLPQSSPEEFIEEDMCTPVFPNTDHPSREPLMPSDPLPTGWTHCYQASFETVTLRVPWAFAKTSLRVTLPQMERARHGIAIVEDEARRAKQVQAQAPQGANLAPMAECEESSAHSNKKNSVSTPPQSVSSRGRTISVASLNEEVALKPVPPPIAAVAYDLAAVQTLEDPQDLLAEIKLIETIYKAARARQLVRRARAKEETARAIEETKKIDEATFGHSIKRSSLPRANGDTPESSTAPESSPDSNHNPVRLVVGFFGNHRFWASPGKHRPTILGALRKWTSCFCNCSKPSSEENVAE